MEQESGATISKILACTSIQGNDSLRAGSPRGEGGKLGEGEPARIPYNFASLRPVHAGREILIG